MKSSASFRISTKLSNLSAKASHRSITSSSSGTSINGISLNSSSSESQTRNAVPISVEYLREPLEDFDSPQTNVSQIISLNIGLNWSLSLMLSCFLYSEYHSLKHYIYILITGLWRIIRSAIVFLKCFFFRIGNSA